MASKKDLIARVNQSLDSMRPYLINDGGDVEIIEITDDFVVKLRLLGACGNCPQSYMTMKAGIEDAIKRAVPEITSVVAENMMAPGA